MIYYASLETPIGCLLIAKSQLGICKISLPSKSDSSFFHWLEDHFPKKKLIEDSFFLSIELEQLRDYFLGKRKNFSLSLDLHTTIFQKKTLEKVTAIAFGETASYKQIAERIKNPKAVRAVGNANGSNPIPIVIPCHRVVANDGSLGGYGGGLPMKKWLLQHEKSHL